MTVTFCPEIDIRNPIHAHRTVLLENLIETLIAHT